ncbi:MAG: hypothetical protein CMP81_25650 [Fulvimarina sp.]|nr:hypothetical protein [Fulvimarina sp.]
MVRPLNAQVGFAVGSKQLVNLVLETFRSALGRSRVGLFERSVLLHLLPDFFDRVQQRVKRFLRSIRVPHNIPRDPFRNVCVRCDGFLRVVLFYNILEFSDQIRLLLNRFHISGGGGGVFTNSGGRF